MKTEQVNKALDLDIKGLAKLLERKGLSWAALELISNAWDTKAKNVHVSLEPIPGRPMAVLTVSDDDPDGFIEFSHAWTLFAESLKKKDPTLRGRFNMGCKLLIAYALAHNGSATVSTTKGSVDFNQTGRHRRRQGRDVGSEVKVELRMTRAQVDEVVGAIRSLIPPQGVTTTLNGEDLGHRTKVHSFDVTLVTEVEDEDGILHRNLKRNATVTLYEPRPGEAASIYEMGIPVVEFEDKEPWHVDIGQKVPLNMDRDNVTPAYRKTLQVVVLNESVDLISEEQAADSWVKAATSDKRCNEDTLDTVLTHQYGEDRVVFDPTDPEGVKRALDRGASIIYPRSLSKGQHENNRRFQNTLPAGRSQYASPKPFSADGDPLKTVNPEDYTAGMKRVVAYSKALAKKLLGKSVRVIIANDISWGYRAAYNQGSMTRGVLYLNVGSLGHSWFNATSMNGLAEINQLLIHEFGHEYSGDHFSSAYHDALCRLGAKMTRLALTDKADLFDLGQQAN